MAYNTHKWREFRLFVTMMTDWFALGLSERESLLNDPWEFSRWLDGRQYVTGRMFRHVVLYLLFPDSFEPIASASHKQQIVKALHHSANDVGDLDLIELDRAVLQVRRTLAQV